MLRKREITRGEASKKRKGQTREEPWGVHRGQRVSARMMHLDKLSSEKHGSGGECNSGMRGKRKNERSGDGPQQ